MAISIQQAMVIIKDKYVIESNAIPIVNNLQAVNTIGWAAH